MNNDDTFLLNKWKTCLEQIDKLETTKNSQNKFFSGLIIWSIFTSIYLICGIESQFASSIFSLIISLLGIFIGVFWKRSLEKIKQLIDIEFEIIKKIEENFEIKLVTERFERLKGIKGTKSISSNLILVIYITILILIFGFCIAKMWGKTV